MTANTNPPRFKVGDRVIVIRKGPSYDMVGRVFKVDTYQRLGAHYVVKFNGVVEVEFPEFDLALFATAGDLTK